MPEAAGSRRRWRLMGQRLSLHGLRLLPRQRPGSEAVRPEENQDLRDPQEARRAAEVARLADLDGQDRDSVVGLDLLGADQAPGRRRRRVRLVTLHVAAAREAQASESRGACSGGHGSLARSKNPGDSERVCDRRGAVVVTRQRPSWRARSGPRNILSRTSRCERNEHAVLLLDHEPVRSVGDEVDRLVADRYDVTRCAVDGLTTSRRERDVVRPGGTAGILDRDARACCNQSG